MGNLFSSVRAIYFDLDDTLCAYWDACRLGLARTFEKHPQQGLAPAQMLDVWAAAYREFCPQVSELGWYDEYLASGEPTRNETMRRMLLRLGIDDPELAQKMGDAYGKERIAALALFPDAIETLTALGARYPLGLITNGPADVQRHEIKALGIEHFFQNVFIEGEMKQGKPHQDVFVRAAAAVGLKPEEILIVGNAYEHDIRPAILAGWRTIWIRRASDVPPSTAGVHDEPVKRSTSNPAPDAEITDIAEVVGLVAGGW